MASVLQMNVITRFPVVLSHVHVLSYPTQFLGYPGDASFDTQISRTLGRRHVRHAKRHHGHGRRRDLEEAPQSVQVAGSYGVFFLTRKKEERVVAGVSGCACTVTIS